MGYQLNSDLKRIFKTGKRIVYQLERLSADSIWARRASGLRGSLIRCLSEIENDKNYSNYEKLEILVLDGVAMLEKAAKEIPDIEANLKNYD